MQNQTGHRRQRQEYKLTFEKPDHMVGLEVICRGPTRRQLFMIAKLGNVDLDSLSADSIEVLDLLASEFGDRIIEWNHQDEEGNDLPPTSATLDDEDWEFTMPLVRAWMLTIQGALPAVGDRDAAVNQHPREKAQFPGQTTIEDQLADLPMM